MKSASRLQVLLGSAALGLLAACSSGRPQHWDLTYIGGLMPSLQFTLIGDNGKPVTAADFAGKVVLLYFGYTHCPDVCPATLAILAQALHRLGTEANRVTVLFVSVDPKRDTPAVLESYVSAFGQHIVGLTGDPGELDALTKRYHVAYRMGTPDAHGNYVVYHSSAIFIFDSRGQVRLISSDADPPSAIAHDLGQLLNITV
jgi:protein SCO1/2